MAKRPTQSLMLDDGNEYEFFGKVFYGVCSTAGGTVAKVVSIPGFTPDSLVAGAVVYVKFNNAHTAGSATLNVSGTGAKPIRYKGNDSVQPYEWSPLQIVALVYDGASWVILDHNHANLSAYGLTKLSNATDSDSPMMAATPKAVNEVRKMIPAVDAALSATSENPVQNKAIYEALEGKADKAAIETKTVSGSVVSFTDGTANAVDALTVTMEPAQSGSGDPSPTNIRPISGFTGATIHVSPTPNAEDGRTYDVSWIHADRVNATDNSNYYVAQGTLNALSGELTVEAILNVFDWVHTEGSTTYITGHVFEMSSASSSVDTIGDYTRITFQRMTGMDASKYNLNSNTYSSAWCNMLKHQFSYNAESASWYINGGTLYAKFPTSLVGTTAASVVSYLTSIKDTNPLSILIPLASPLTFQLTAQQVRTLLGTNYVWCDAGDISLTYTATDDQYAGIISQIDAKLAPMYGYNPISFTAAAGWRGSSNNFYNTAGHYHVDIPVAAGEKYHIKTRTNNASIAGAAFFPSDFSSGTDVIAGAASGWVEDYITIPDDVAYLTVNCAHAYSVTIEKYGVLSEDGSLPDHFRTEADATVETAKSFCQEKALVLAVVTDSHLNEAYGYQVWNDTVKNIAAVNAAYQIDGIVHLGDMINGDNTAAVGQSQLDMMRNGIREIGHAVYLEGNHDLNSFYNNMSDPITEADMYAEMFRFNAKDIVRPDGKLYGYRDYDALGIRVVYLLASMGDGTHGGQGTNWGYPSDELTWVQNVALDTDYHVLFFSHMPMTEGFISASSTLPANGNALKTIVSDFVTGGGVVIGLICGHTHYDYLLDNGSFTEVSIGCEAYTYSASDAAPADSFAPSSAIIPARMRYTVTQDLWDLVIVRPVSRTVKLVRFGAGSDRAFSY